MKKDERYRKICTDLLRSRTFFNLETAPIEELTAVVDFIKILQYYRPDDYDKISLWEINKLFTVED